MPIFSLYPISQCQSSLSGIQSARVAVASVFGIDIAMVGVLPKPMNGLKDYSTRLICWGAFLFFYFFIFIFFTFFGCFGHVIDTLGTSQQQEHLHG